MSERARMSAAAHCSAVTPDRAGLAAGLRARRPELKQALLARVQAIPDPSGELDSDHREGLRRTLGCALEYGFATLESGEDQAPPIPPELLVQARMAARHRICLDTVLRRYFAGYALLNEFILREAEETVLVDSGGLAQLLRGQAALFDRMLEAIVAEHAREARRWVSSEGHRTERVERLLAGELIDASDLSYDFEGHHLAVVATHADLPEEMLELAAGLECSLLLVPDPDGGMWVWLGGRRALDPDEVRRLVGRSAFSGIHAAVGEPGKGLVGWRRSHRQARAALPIAVRSGECCVRYADVALPASLHQDDLLATSLRQLYLEPLQAAPTARSSATPCTPTLAPPGTAPPRRQRLV